MKSREEVEVVQQATFGESGEVEVEPEVDTDLSDWGLVDEEQERETRFEVEAMESFGEDTREVTRQCQSKQGSLFVDVEEDQQTLEGETASGQSRWD